MKKLITILLLLITLTSVSQVQGNYTDVFWRKTQQWSEVYTPDKFEHAQWAWGIATAGGIILHEMNREFDWLNVNAEVLGSLFSIGVFTYKETIDPVWDWTDWTVSAFFAVAGGITAKLSNDWFDGELEKLNITLSPVQIKDRMGGQLSLNITI